MQALVEHWRSGQGRDVLAAWGMLVAHRCEALVRHLAEIHDSEMPAELFLTEAEFERERMRVVSSLRCQIYGAYSLRRNDGGERWKYEVALVEYALRTGEPLPVDERFEARRKADEGKHEEPAHGRDEHDGPAGDGAADEPLDAGRADPGRDAPPDP